MLYKTIIKVLIFTLLCFSMIELSYRIYAVGGMALQPVRFNSLNLLMRSGLIQRSQYPSVFYELKPNLDTWFHGVRFKTNSAGMADREYKLEKPENTFRVAVVGSSWTMATSIEQEYTFHSVLEDELSGASEEWNYEFLNFGVEHYGLRELVGTTKHRVLKWDPDLILFGITAYSGYLRWDEPTGIEELPNRTYPLFQSYALRAFDRKNNLGIYNHAVPSRQSLESTTDGLYEAQVIRALNELHKISVENNVPVMFMWLSYRNPGKVIEAALQAASTELDMFYLQAYKALIGPDILARKLQTGRFDKHPNKEAHARLASSIKATMIENKLLPE